MAGSRRLSAADIALGSQAVNRSSVAALSVLVYDVILSFEEEVHLIWPQPWSVMKGVFFLVRYMPIFVQISLLFVGTELTPLFGFTLEDCFIWQVYQSVVVVVLIGVVDIILILRVYALFPGNVILRSSLWLLYFAEIAGWMAGLYMALPGVRTDENCVVIGMPKEIAITGISTILFQTYLLVLTMYKFLKNIYLERGKLWENNFSTTNRRIVTLVMRDGTWAFFLMFALMMGNASLFLLKNSAFAGVLYCWIVTTLSFVGYRILLNLRWITADDMIEQEASLTSDFTLTTQVP